MFWGTHMDFQHLGSMLCGCMVPDDQRTFEESTGLGTLY